MTRKNPYLRRATATLGAATLAAGSLLFFASPSLAAVGPDQPGAPTGGTLKINKYSGAPVAEGETPDPRNLLDGVEFTVQQVGDNSSGTCTAIDLTKAEDWTGLDTLFNSAPNAPADPYCLVPGSSTSLTTTDGKAVFDLNVGVYFVQETDPGNNNIVSKVPDFYVSIPTSNGDEGDGWNYNVVADPKNQIMDAPSKEINPAQGQFTLGSEVEWTLTVPVPTLNNETFNEAIVEDVLDSRLDYVEGSSVVTLDGATLDDETDFSVAGNATWTFTPELFNSHMGGELKITFKTKVISVGDGAIPNDEYTSSFNGTEVPGEVDPYTYWGQLSILKTDDSKPTALNLEGAEFQVFNLLEDGTCPSAAPESGAIATGTSGSDGVVMWNHTNPASSPLGLWVANTNNGPADPVPTKSYCVFETVVPAGHTATPIANPVVITPGEANVNPLTVVNPKTEGPDLPLTGAQGTIALTIGGAVIVAAGTGLMIAARRRQGKQNA
ncbi:SpaH/EbpB family LPXTG-anchored major pilin [Glutamicibacter nicotianae]|uniref:SpaH/EbpB family LPXTG-anchored major pilin n=1 Tax=Glutamicibacter nicotianae TaxID=37929 RepID=UPI00255535CE|nr:SpaH/EbpB family LPXTG-anchored major pilin [Glutamicibacter nicotianae]WIV45352.1 SpaH/EbpB family LPXTG-anchored major pilin [Glutamicibacter nicotianae]